jgi:hypothetical protein
MDDEIQYSSLWLRSGCPLSKVSAGLVSRTPYRQRRLLRGVPCSEFAGAVDGGIFCLSSGFKNVRQPHANRVFPVLPSTIFSCRPRAKLVPSFRLQPFIPQA